VKHLNEITVIDNIFDGFWMKTAYRIPDNDCNCAEPGTAPKATIPINRFKVRSFITSVADGAKLKDDAQTTLKGRLSPLTQLSGFSFAFAFAGRGKLLEGAF
jgi:sulfite dehydrogenase